MGTATEATGPFQILVVKGAVATPAVELRHRMPWWPVFRLMEDQRPSFWRVVEVGEWPKLVDVTIEVEAMLTATLTAKLTRHLAQPRRPAQRSFTGDEIRPTSERRNHARAGEGDIVRAEPDRKDPKTGSIQYLDARGEPGSPFKVVDTLDAMLRAETITKKLHTAGDTFRTQFELSGYAGVRAAPILRTGSTGTPSTTLPDLVLDAAAEVDAVLRMLVLGSPACRAVVEICGQGTSLNAWVERERIRRKTGQQILIDALAAMAAHYDIA